MADKEKGYFVSSENDQPSRELLPSGQYKYIYFGLDGTVIFSSFLLPQQHEDLTDRVFYNDTDDAGYINLEWAKTPEEIDQQVASFQEHAKLKGLEFDPLKYRRQLKEGLGVTSVEVGAFGSSTLKYRPNPVTRSRFMERLGELFPDAKISQGVS